MRAAWYDRTGAAKDVLVVGDLPDPEPNPGQVRVRVEAAGLNPVDVKRRSGAGGRTMTFPRIIPGNDGAGVIDQVGPGVADSRVGERVWVYSACENQPYGTAAEYVVVPAHQAVRLPDSTNFDEGACLGIPALTAHRCLFADGPIDGMTVLVTGGAGSVGHYAIELAKHAGARVIATASTSDKQDAALAAGADHVVDYRRSDARAVIADFARTTGISRIIDVAFGVNIGLTSTVIATNGVIATYASDEMPEPVIPFGKLMRQAVTIRTVQVFKTPDEAIKAAISDITSLLSAGALTHPIFAHYQLEEIARAHVYVERGRGIGKVLVVPASATRPQPRPAVVATSKGDPGATA
jgi:NADPH:quinone reductase